MEPIRIRVTRIIDFGTIVSIVGVDLESNAPVMVHVDHLPFQVIWDTWKAARHRSTGPSSLTLVPDPDRLGRASSAHTELGIRLDS